MLSHFSILHAKKHTLPYKRVLIENRNAINIAKGSITPVIYFRIAINQYLQNRKSGLVRVALATVATGVWDSD